MKNLIRPLFLLGLTTTFVGCNLVDRVESTAAYYNGLEDQVIVLTRTLQQKDIEIKRLEYEVKKLEEHSAYMELALNESGLKRPGRSIASIASALPSGEDDLVRYEIYQWSPEQMRAIAHDEFKKKNYAKAAQFYKAMSFHYPDNPMVKTDEFLFQAGIAAFESGVYHHWVKEHLNELVSEHPTSKYFRGAKLWLGLNHLRLGDNKAFFETYEEFRTKYRNTPEWTILSAHHEKILQYKP